MSGNSYERRGRYPQLLPAARPDGLVAAKRRIAVNWEGPLFTHFGMAVVNRELCRELAAHEQVDLRVIGDREPPTEAAATDTRFASLRPLQGRHCADSVDVHVRHQWPPNFDPPTAGRWVLMQPWEFGSPPRAWIEPINTLVDEVWVPSEYVRRCFVDGGVKPDRVFVIPNGVDTHRFNPQAPVLQLPTKAKFRFLFVGGTIFRKGIDILLEAYARAFGPGDDVCLLVKDLGADTFYRGQNLRERVLAMAADARNPEIVYLGNDLSGEQMPGLYVACDCLVHPYRGEGFGLPIVEAMACGLPVVVPNYGPALELCTNNTAFFVPWRELRLAHAAVGDLETVDIPVMAEVEVEALVRTMRVACANPDRVAAMGRLGREHVCRHFTWHHAAQRALARLEILVAKPPHRNVLAGYRRQVIRPDQAASAKRVASAAPTTLAGNDTSAKHTTSSQHNASSEYATSPENTVAPRLSVCMIVRNESRLLSRALSSVRDVADEIVVVDTGSTDNSVEIARSYGARVFHDQWRDDWAAARNASIDHAIGDWILVLDADQTVDLQSHPELQGIMRKPDADGYFLFERSYTDESGASLIEHRSLRLFRRRPDIRYHGRIHEQVVRGGEPLPAALCNVIVHHDGYRPGVRDVRQKALRDLPILQALLVENPGDAFHNYNLGLTYNALGEHEKAEQAMRRSLSSFAEQGLFSFHYAHANVMLALSLIPQQRLDEAAGACRTAIEIMPALPDAHCTLGAVEFRRGDLEAAFAGYHGALACHGKPLAEGMRDASAATWKALLGMGEVRLVQRRVEEAVALLTRAREFNPGHAPILTALAQAYHTTRRVDEARNTLEAVLETPQPPAHAWSLLANILIEQSRDDVAEQVLRDGISRHPGDFTCHRELYRLLQRLGRGEEAAAALRELAGQKQDAALFRRLAASVSADQGDLDAALEQLALALKADDRNSQTFRELGAVLLARRNSQEAEQAFLAATLLDPLDDLARRGLQAARAATGNAEE